MSWHLCRPLLFPWWPPSQSPIPSTYSKNYPVTFVHWQTVAIATAPLSIGFGQSAAVTGPYANGGPQGHHLPHP